MKLFAFITLLLSVNAFAACPEWMDTSMRKLHSSETVNFCEDYWGRPMLIVNTASHCGFTKQLKGLEKIHKEYYKAGLAVIGFASNDFWQGADSEAEAAEICYVNFGVTFTMIAQSSVRGKNANKIFAELSEQVGSPSWNFNKYLVGRDGNIAVRYGSNTSPDSRKLTSAIESILK